MLEHLDGRVSIYSHRSLQHGRSMIRVNSFGIEGLQCTVCDTQ